MGNEIGVFLRQAKPKVESLDFQNLNLQNRQHERFENRHNNRHYGNNSYQRRDRRENSFSEKRQSNITASGIPMSNTLDDSGTSISYLPGTASLVEEVDRKQMVVLRDGKILIGMLRSVDQFGNLALQDTIQRTVIDNRNRLLQQMPKDYMEIKNAELLKKLADSDKEKNRNLRDRGMYAYKEMPGDQYV